MKIKEFIIGISKLIRGEIPINKLKSMGLNVGENFYRAGGGLIDPSAPHLISIGKNVSFSRNVTVLAHDASLKESLGIIKFGLVSIGDNVFIGANSTIILGVSIGNNSIIGAGSIVTKNIPENCVAVGNPAKVIYTLDEYKTKTCCRINENNYFTKTVRFNKEMNQKQTNSNIKQILKKENIGYAEASDKCVDIDDLKQRYKIKND